MAEARSFAELEGRASRERRRCTACGAQETAGVVAVSARAYGDGGNSQQLLKGGRTLASASASLCEACVVERYEAVEAALRNEVLDA